MSKNNTPEHIHRLLDEQIRKASAAAGAIDYQQLFVLISKSYAQHEKAEAESAKQSRFLSNIIDYAVSCPPIIGPDLIS